jgi:hypothetical protein
VLPNVSLYSDIAKRAMLKRAQEFSENVQRALFKRRDEEHSYEAYDAYDEKRNEENAFDDKRLIQYGEI